MPATASQSADRRSGFTLLEILVTVALIGLLTGVLVVGASSLLGDRPKSAEELFWAAVAATRKDALQHNRDVRLGFDAKTHEFISVSNAGEARHPFVAKELGEIDFLAPATPGSPSVLLGGQLIETQTVPSVIFYRDGTCSPFRVQLKGRAATRILQIDPWTCAPVLTAATTR